MFAHVGHEGTRLHQRIPFPLDILGARYEYLVMKALGWLNDTDWLYRFRPTRRFVDWLANRVILPIIHGEVVTPTEVEEMLRLVDKPLIQYGVEEAIRSGVQNIFIVTGRGKSAIEDHFDVSFELEQTLSSRNKHELLRLVRELSDMINVAYIRQKEALGLGHAVLRAKELIAREPFAVILSDDVIDSEVPCLRQLLDIYEYFGASVVALMEVPEESVSAYGIVEAEPVEHNGARDRLFRIHSMVEKPKPGSAPSRLAIIGRYVLTPEIFASIEAVEPGAGGEIQLTDGLKHLLRSRPIYGYRFEGKRYDAGDKLGFLKATVEFALRREDLGAAFREYLRNLDLSKL